MQDEATHSATQTPETQNKRPVILVVDDDKKILDAFSYFIEAENCDLIQAADIEEAMDKIDGVTLDLIFTDFYLKTKSSVELYMLVRKKQPNVPIAVITGYPEFISEDDVKIFGANYFLTKPLDLNKMRTIIRRHCFGQEPA